MQKANVKGEKAWGRGHNTRGKFRNRMVQGKGQSLQSKRKRALSNKQQAQKQGKELILSSS